MRERTTAGSRSWCPTTAQGIPADQREKVFVPFYTTKRQGSGIGPTLVRQIAAAHGAPVDVSQTPGGGATVRLRF